MARPNRSGLTEAGSVPVATRLPNDLYVEALTKAGGKEGLSEWLRQVVHAAVHGKLPSLGAAQTAGFEEGKRQGWANANKVFREALRAAAEELKG